VPASYIAVLINISEVEVIGIYNADGTVWGEVSYWVGARIGTAHCSLCEITHGTFRESAEWKSCRDSLSVPFSTFHRNDQPDDVRAAANDITPVVVARTVTGCVMLLGPEDIETCQGRAEHLASLIEQALSRLQF
jgi:hypothetical protein